MSTKIMLIFSDADDDQGESLIKTRDLTVSELVREKDELVRDQIQNLVVEALREYENDAYFRDWIRDEGWVNIRKVQENEKMLIEEDEYIIVDPDRHHSGRYRHLSSGDRFTCWHIDLLAAKDSQVFKKIRKSSFVDSLSPRQRSEYERKVQAREKQEESKRKVQARRKREKKEREIENAKKLLAKVDAKKTK